MGDLLAQPRARDAFVLRVVMGRPWGVRVEDEAPLSIVSVLRGSMWFEPDGAAALPLRAGDVLLVRAPTAYSLGSAPGVPTKAVIGAGQTCSGADGRDLSQALSSGVRSWGNDPLGADELLVGSYRTESELGRLMIGSLPAWTVVREPAPEIVQLLAQETAEERPGQGSVLDRLLDVLVGATLRTWLEGADGGRAGLVSAHRDDVIRVATAAVQGRPAQEWDVTSLAALAGVSRSSLTRHFTAVLGMPPMVYVTRWRLATAAEMLVSSDATIASVARQVGYATPFSFSAAFKSRYAMSPSEFRSTHRG